MDELFFQLIRLMPVHFFFSNFYQSCLAKCGNFAEDCIRGRQRERWAYTSDSVSLLAFRYESSFCCIFEGIFIYLHNLICILRLNCQVDVISQLGGRIDQQLRAQETRIQRMSRTDASRNRATHVKLTRDFRRVEATFNKLKLELKQRRGLVEARRAQEEDERRFAAEASSSEQAMRLEMQLQEDVSN